MNNITNDDEEESLSLSNFNLNSDHRRRPSSQPSDSFEFSNDSKSDHMSHAEDIISCGKLMPYKQPPPLDDQIPKYVSDDYDSINLSRRYCDSLPDLDPTRSNSTRLIRSSRSVDCKKLRRNSSIVMKSEASDVHRNFSKSSEKSEPSIFRGSKPRWYNLMFGLGKFPTEMDLRDMRSRQVRRIQGSMSPAVEAGGRSPVNRRSSWGQDLVRVLSCKDDESVGVTPSLRLSCHKFEGSYSRDYHVQKLGFVNDFDVRTKK